MNFIQNMILEVVKKYLWRFEKGVISFSQEGEDLLLARLLEGESGDKFYVDVGAHHPKRFSNTFKFYLEGWNGICIDPLPGAKELYQKHRSRDIFLNIGISSTKASLDYFEFNDPALNGFDPSLIEQREKAGYRLIGKKMIETLPLKEALDGRVKKRITFMNIDTEGLDLQVLQSNDWNKYRPKFVLVENLDKSNNSINEFLLQQDYVKVAQSYNTGFFKSRS